MSRPYSIAYSNILRITSAVMARTENGLLYPQQNVFHFNKIPVLKMSLGELYGIAKYENVPGSLKFNILWFVKLSIIYLSRLHLKFSICINGAFL